MKTLIFILLFLFPINLTKEYPTKAGKPTPQGVEMYITDYKDILFNEYQEFIEDTLWLEVWIKSKDLTNYTDHDTLELGRYYDGEIIISMDTLFDAYQLEDLSKFQRSLLVESNAFVKSTTFHELTHHYINQIGREMEFYDSVDIHNDYEINVWIIRTSDFFAVDFIEEGICEYMVTKMGENIPPKRYQKPRNVNDLIDKHNRYKYVYKYSSYYLKEFLDTIGFKRGVKTLISNDPPTYNEILDPATYFNRLEIIKDGRDKFNVNDY